MRTKHLFCTLALAGTFTACMQEDFLRDDGNEALAGRKSLGNITFVKEEIPSTRWAVDNFNTISPEDGDGFSLFLVDIPRKGQSADPLYPIDGYELVNDIQTNYLFKKNGGGWDSEASLVEGNYLFVAPAQKTLERKPIEITLPIEQNLSLGVDGKLDPLSGLKEFAKSGHPFYIGHRFLSEGGSKRNALPAMLNIFAYPEITVKNTNSERKDAAILKKVIIKQQNKEKSFIVNAPLDNVKTARLLTNEWFAKRGTDTKDLVVVGNWSGHMSEYFGAWKNIRQDSKADGSLTAIPASADYAVKVLGNDGTYGESTNYLYNNGLHGKTADLLGTPNTTNQYIVINMPGDGIELAYNESISFNAIIPADSYSMNDGSDDAELTIYAVLQNDEAYEKVMKSNTQIDMYPGKRYPNQDYSGLEVKGDKGLYFTIDVNDGASDGLSTYKKISASKINGVETEDATAALIAAIKAHSSTEDLYIIVQNKDAVYNEEVNNAVANTNCQNIFIQGHIRIAGGTSEPLVINDRVSIDNAVLESGMVTFEGKNSSLGKIVIADGASLNLRSTQKGTTVYNVGTLTLATTNIAKVYNFHNLNVDTDLSADGLTWASTGTPKIENVYEACGDMAEIISPSIDLHPSVTVLAGGKYAISGDLYYPITVNAKNENKAAGELALKGNTQIAKLVKYIGSKEVEMVGEITNNGNISGSTLTINKGLTMEIGTEGTIGSAIVIEAASHPLDAMVTGVSDYVPAAQVINNGQMTGEVTVNGLLIMGNSNARIENIADASMGEIDNTAKGVIADDPASGVTVFATIGEIDLTDTDAQTATINKLKAFTTATKKVTVFRLNGLMEIGNTDVTLNQVNIGTDVEAIEFVAGSSLQIGEATFTSDCIVVSAPDVQWNGRTSGVSKFSLTNATKGYYYVGYDANDKKYYSAKGNVEFNNCATVSGLQ